MKKHLIIKQVKKLQGKRRIKAAARLERKVRETFVEEARAFAAELRAIEQEVKSLPAPVSKEWLWLADIRRSAGLMDQVIEVLSGLPDIP